MLFDSLHYLIFLPIVVVFYFLLKAKWRNLFLLAASYYFYMQWNAKYLLLILTSTVVTYGTALFMSKLEANEKRKRKFYLILSLAINLGILFLFKYFGLFASSLNYLLAGIGLKPLNSSLNLLLPVGISFYTFQALSYTIDVYRQKYPAEKNFIDYALFVSFFPQLVAGPIERTENLLPQLKSDLSFTLQNFIEGSFLIIVGMAMKLVLADRLAIIVNQIFNNYQQYSAPLLWTGAIAFALQIYCDFNSYSTIARGSAKLLGIDIMENFRQPFFATSLKEVWHRWHISLSTWFRDYVYISLGGSRCKFERICFNLLVVFALSGLWHGADYKFLVWGLLNGFFIILQMIYEKYRRQQDYQQAGSKSSLVNNLKRIATFLIFSLIFVFFRADTIGIALEMIAHMFNSFTANLNYMQALTAVIDYNNLIVLMVSLSALFIYSYINERKAAIAQRYANLFFVWRWLISFVIIFATIIYGIYGPEFSEAQFIYFQF